MLTELGFKTILSTLPHYSYQWKVTSLACHWHATEPYSVLQQGLQLTMNSTHARMSFYHQSMNGIHRMFGSKASRTVEEEVSRTIGAIMKHGEDQSNGRDAINNACLPLLDIRTLSQRMIASIKIQSVARYIAATEVEVQDIPQDNAGDQFGGHKKKKQKKEKSWLYGLFLTLVNLVLSLCKVIPFTPMRTATQAHRSSSKTNWPDANYCMRRGIWLPCWHQMHSGAQDWSTCGPQPNRNGLPRQHNGGWI